jgi:hypothetical protein
LFAPKEAAGDDDYDVEQERPLLELRRLQIAKGAT